MKNLLTLPLWLWAISAICLSSVVGTGVLNAQGANHIELEIQISQADTKDPIQGVSVYFSESRQIGGVSNAEGIITLHLEKEYLPDSLYFNNTAGYAKHPNLYITNAEQPIQVNLRSYDSDEIVVEGNAPTLIRSSETVTNDQNITRRGLMKAACCNLSESFETNPAVDVNFQDAVTGAKRISMLGLDGKYSQIMTEKTPNVRGLAIPYGMNFIPGSWMQSIQISKGTSTVATGYESVTGQINVEYKKPEAQEPLFVNGYVNQIGRSELNIDYSPQLTENLHSMFFFHGSVSPFEFDRNDDGFVDIPLKRDLSAMGRLKYEGEEIVGQIGFKAINNKTLGGQMGYHSGIDAPLTPNPTSDKYGVGIGIERYEAWGKTGTIFDFDTDVSLGLIVSAYSHDQNSFIGRNLYTGREDFINANLIFETGEYEGGHKFSLGSSLMMDYVEEEYQFLSYKRNEIVPGAFGEYTFTGINDLTAVLGVRVDAHNIFGTYVTPRIHTKYDFTDNSSFRASAGRGWRAPFYIAETQGMLVSGRDIEFVGEQMVEDAWNYGASYNWYGEIFGMSSDFNIDFYHTDFARQFITDRDADPTKIIYTMMNDAGYSNAFQTNISIEPAKRMNLILGYRYNDVQAQMGGKLRQLPLMSPHMGFLNWEYTTNLRTWAYDITLAYQGSGRYPTNAEGLVQNGDYDGWLRVNAQVSYDWDGLEIYVGGENLLDFQQPNAIIAADNPFSRQFDASQVWAPIFGRMIYTGFRYSFY